jgi:hypothetical protein
MHRKRLRVEELAGSSLQHSITPSLQLSTLYLSIYIEQHGKMYLPFNCFHLGSLASCAALWEELGDLRGMKKGDGWEKTGPHGIPEILSKHKKRGTL